MGKDQTEKGQRHQADESSGPELMACSRRGVLEQRLLDERRDDENGGRLQGDRPDGEEYGWRGNHFASPDSRACSSIFARRSYSASDSGCSDMSSRAAIAELGELRKKVLTRCRSAERLTSSD